MSFISENFGDAVEYDNDREEEELWWIKQQQAAEEHEGEICSYCDGSGEGWQEWSRCPRCKGKGEL